MTDQPYQTPQSDVQPETRPGGSYGSVENALAGNYEIQIGDVVKESWERIKGFKGSALAAILLIYGVAFAGGFLIGMLLPGEGLVSIIAQIAITLILIPMEMGLVMMGIRRSTDQSYSFSMIFNYFGYFIPITLCVALMYILIVIGLVLLIIPGIYLAFAYCFAMPLVVEKNMGVWEALETSRKAVSKKWFSIFGLWIVIILLVLASAIPLGIGLFWTLPMVIVAYAIVYRDIFGIEPIQG